MPKLIVKSKSWCFNGLYFRQTLPNSIEWTSFQMAAAVFETPDEAKTKMESSGIKYWELEEAPEQPKIWGTIYGNNLKKRAFISGHGKDDKEPWYQEEDGTQWSAYDVRFVPDKATSPEPYRESGQLFKAAHTTEDPSKTRPTFTPSDKTGFKIGSTMSL